jgi:hypothetical protein
VLASLGETVGSEFLDALGTLVRDRLAEPSACKSIRRREPRASAA